MEEAPDLKREAGRMKIGGLSSILKCTNRWGARMNWWLKVFAHVVALAMFGLMSYAAFVQPSGAWPLAVAAIFIVFIANLDRFSEISASTSGISATVREAKSKIAELKNMIQLTAEFQMHALQSANRWGGGEGGKIRVFFYRISRRFSEMQTSMKRKYRKSRKNFGIPM
ncbi:hypothetical protein Q1M63_24485 [Sinorhizobium meliloti]|nr:hypothetical protein Q1M63_24485 [Sinorhizobium meliloti]